MKKLYLIEYGSPSYRKFSINESSSPEEAIRKLTEDYTWNFSDTKHKVLVTEVENNFQEYNVTTDNRIFRKI